MTEQILINLVSWAPDDALDEVVHIVTQEETLGELNGTADEDEQEAVIATAEHKAAEINNQGIAAQVNYLMGQGWSLTDIVQEQIDYLSNEGKSTAEIVLLALNAL